MQPPSDDETDHEGRNRASGGGEVHERRNALDSYAALESTPFTTPAGTAPHEYFRYCRAGHPPPEDG
jgi:hypothetical protein